MKNFFTGTLAFIVYAGLCLAFFGYYYIEQFTGKNTNFISSDVVNEQPIIDELPSDELESELEPVIQSILDQQLDSIAAAKALINTLSTSEDSTVTKEYEVSNAEAALGEVSEESTIINGNKETAVYEANTFTINDQNGNPLTNCSTFTTIYKNNSKVKIPYPCRAYGNEIKEVLSSNPKAEIIINGYSSIQEDADIGMKRAQYVKRLLTNIGIKADKITLKSDTKDIPFKSGIAQGGIDIQILNINRAESNSNAVKASPTTAVPTISSGNGPYGYQRFTKGYQGDFFYGNRAFTAYIKEVQNYLNKNPGKKVYVYAYTDTVGNATDNFNIGKDNVNTARRLMIQNGIAINRIVAVSKGEESSGATGNNRSLVVIVK